MCIEDYAIKRLIKWRKYEGSAAFATDVEFLPYDESRWGIVFATPSTQQLQLLPGEATNNNLTILRVDSTPDFKQYYTFDELGAFMWQSWRVRMSGSGVYLFYELYLDTEPKNLKQAIRAGT
jgi:hypothetical protein